MKKNHDILLKEIKEKFESFGYKVCSKGFPDLLIYEPSSGFFIFVEVKTKGSNLSKKQRETFSFFEEINFPVAVIRKRDLENPDFKNNFLLWGHALNWEEELQFEDYHRWEAEIMEREEKLRKKEKEFEAFIEETKEKLILLKKKVAKNAVKKLRREVNKLSLRDNSVASIPFLKYRIFDHVWQKSDAWLLGSFDHTRNIAFVYIDEIARFVYDKYPLDWGHDVLIRSLSLSALHELTHGDFKRVLSHEIWDRFLAKEIWSFLR